MVEPRVCKTCGHTEDLHPFRHPFIAFKSEFGEKPPIPVDPSETAVQLSLSAKLIKLRGTIAEMHTIITGVPEWSDLIQKLHKLADSVVDDVAKLRLEGGAEQRDALVERLSKLFGWKDTGHMGFVHALMHVDNAVNNLRADIAVEHREGFIEGYLRGLQSAGAPVDGVYGYGREDAERAWSRYDKDKQK